MEQGRKERSKIIRKKRKRGEMRKREHETM